IKLTLEKTADGGQPVKAAPISPSTENPNFSGKHILAVDDSEDNLFLIEMFLKSSGVKITSVENGADAIRETKSKNFDLILMDMQMAGMDGRETTMEIRKMGFKGP